MALSGSFAASREKGANPGQKISAKTGFQSRIILEDIQNLAKALSGHKSFFEGKTFLITGAGGFLGKYMVWLLQYLNEHVLSKKAHAIFLDNFIIGQDFQFTQNEYFAAEKHNVIEPFHSNKPIDYIIHAAGIASPAYYTKYPIQTMDVGTIGTRNMLNLAVEKKSKSFIFMSSSEVYGDPDPKFIPTPETYNGNVSVSGPRACYDESKRFGETMCVAFWREHKVPVKIIRPFNVYGPGIRPGDFRVLPNFIEHALNKQPLQINGSGENTRTFCYINDEIEAIFKLLFSEANGEAFNVGNPEPEISVKEVAKMVAAEFVPPAVIEHITPTHAVYESSDPKRRCPDISKLQSVIDFKPRYDLKTGLKRTIDWFSGQ